MSEYLVLIYGDGKQWALMSPEDERALADGHADFQRAAGRALLGGHELEPVSRATTLRGGDTGQPTRTDGPFLETKEWLGGYYLLEAPDLDAALSLAGRLPELRLSHCAVEVRPVRG